MSRLIRKPIPLVNGVAMEQRDGELLFKGPKGEFTMRILDGVAVTTEEGGIKVATLNNIKQTRANGGTMWSLIRNTLEGLSTGYTKVLEIQGVGYRAALDGKTLVLSLGYVHPVRYDGPADVTIELEKNLIKISGSNKESVGQTAAKIRAFKKPEPYKGKGIRYQGEVIRMKAGKKAASGK